MSYNLNVDSRYKNHDHKKRAKMKKQRAVQGYCDADVWNLDSYLLDLIPSMLDHLANNCHGYAPFVCKNGVKETMNETKWIDYLHGLASRFRKVSDDADRMLEESDLKSIRDRSEIIERQTKELFTELGENLYSMWD